MDALISAEGFRSAAPVSSAKWPIFISDGIFCAKVERGLIP